MSWLERFRRWWARWFYLCEHAPASLIERDDGRSQCLICLEIES
jgi:hypothetical protein